jgi:SprT protein
MIENLVQPLNDSIDEWYDKAKNLFGLPNWKRPKLDIVSLNGTVSGKALWPNNEIQINFTLWKQNTGTFKVRTIPHEIAHLVSFMVNGRSDDGHGPKWKYIMQRLGVKDISPCHRYDTTSVRPVVIAFEYVCGCGNKQYTDSKGHYTVAGGKGILPCRRCHKPTKATGNTKRM